MQKREAHDTDAQTPASGAPTTPRASGEVVAGKLVLEEQPPSNANPTLSAMPAAPPSEPSDTLLSAGKPAAKLELLLEDHQAFVEARLAELESRIEVLEQGKTSLAPETRQKPWLWIAFLIALVVVFQLLQRVR